MWYGDWNEGDEIRVEIEMFQFGYSIPGHKK